MPANDHGLAGPQLGSLTPGLLAGPQRAAITAATRQPEPDVLPALLALARQSTDQAGATQALALRIARGVRERKADGGRAGLVQSLLQEFALSSQEGVALMCLAEALLRIPDAATRDALIRDKIGSGNWQSHLGSSESLFVNAATWGLLLTGKLVATHSEVGLGAALRRIVGRGGEPLIRRGVDMAMRLMGEQFVTGETIAQALSQRAPPRGRGLSLLLRHARRSGDDRAGRAGVSRRLRTGDPRHRRRVGRPRHLRGPGHLDQAVGTAPALQPRAGGTRDGRAVPAPAAPDRSGASPRHRPEHRRRRVRPAGAVARPARTPVPRARARRLERHRLRRAGLPEALPCRDRLPDRSGAPQPASPDDPTGQGRVLGQRDQARAARRPGRLSGLHAQGLHRRRLHRLRAQAARRARGGVPAVRDPQRPHAGRGVHAGGAELLRRPVRVPVPARHGRTAVRTGGRRGGFGQAGAAMPHLRAGGHARHAAGVPGATPARERRQHLIRQPHRQRRHCARGSGAGPRAHGAADGRS